MPEKIAGKRDKNSVHNYKMMNERFPLDSFKFSDNEIWRQPIAAARLYLAASKRKIPEENLRKLNQPLKRLKLKQNLKFHVPS
jgi:hypothetical protein